MPLTNKTFGEMFDFTRASPKWVFNSDGVLVEVPVDTPAYDHDPVTGESLGVLIEESRTNLLTYSEAFDNAVWVNFFATVSPDTAVAPDGTTTADKVVATTDNNYHGVRRFIDTSTTGLRVITCFFKSAEYSFAWINDNAYSKFRASFDLTNLTTPQLVGTASVNTVSSEAVDVGGGWVRCSVTLDVKEADTGATLSFTGAPRGTYSYPGGPYYTGDGTSGIYLWGAQLEEASTASSYIPTTSAAVTRAADNLSRTLGAEFNPDGITICSEAKLPTSRPDNVAVFTLNNDDTTSTPRRDFRVAPSGEVMNGGTRTGLYINEGVSNKFAYSITSNGSVTYGLNGASSVEYTTTSINAQFGFIHIGRIFSGLFYINGNTKSLYHYPYAITAAELEALTTP